MSDRDRLAGLVFEARGALRLAPCVRVTLYVDTTPKAETIEYCDAALALLRPQLRFYQAGSMTRPAACSTKVDGLISSWFRRPRERQFNYALFSGVGQDGISAATLRIVLTYRTTEPLPETEREVRRKRRRVLYEEQGVKVAPPVGEITLTLPLDAEMAEPAALLRWLLARPLITATPFASGHTGLGFNYDKTVADNAFGAEIEGRAAYALTRHPGLDWQKDAILDQIMRYDRRTRDLVPHVKRVNWLTIVGSRTLAALGSASEIAARLATAPSVAVHPVQHGLIVQAGAGPAIGDRNSGDLPVPYCHVGKVLRPVRLPTLTGGGPAFPDELAQRWLEAFDRDETA